MQTKATRRLGRIATLAVAAAGLTALALPLQGANAQGIYLGWDFGNGVGIGLGTPPSAYGYHYCGFVATYQPCYY
jgi:hypothetical protein